MRKILFLCRFNGIVTSSYGARRVFGEYETDVRVAEGDTRKATGELLVLSKSPACTINR